MIAYDDTLKTKHLCRMNDEKFLFLNSKIKKKKENLLS